MKIIKKKLVYVKLFAYLYYVLRDTHYESFNF